MEKTSIKQAIDIFGTDSVIEVLTPKKKNLEEKITLKKSVLEALLELQRASFKVFITGEDIPLKVMSEVWDIYDAVTSSPIKHKQDEIALLEKELKNITFALDTAKGKSMPELDVEHAKQCPITSLCPTEVRGSGRVKIAMCPFHDEEQPSLRIYTDTNTFYCFSCKRGGDVIAFVMELKGIKFKEAVRYLS